MARILSLWLVALFCQGAVSLKGWEPDSILEIEGDWLFFYDEHLTPQEFLQRLREPALPSRTTTVGKTFRESAGKAAKEEYGIATFVMPLQDGPARFKDTLGLFANNIFTASRLYFFAADGQGGELPVQVLGVPGQDKASTEPQFATERPVQLNWYGAQNHYILIQVSNFHYHRSGLRSPLELGSYRLLESASRNNDDINFLVVGVILLATVYNVFIYLNRREDRGSLLLALFGAFLLVRLFALSTVADNSFGDFNLSHEFFWKVIFATMVVPGVIFLTFLHFFFPRQTPLRVLQAFGVIALLYFLVVLCMPVRVYGTISGMGKITSAVLALLALYILIRACKDKERGSVISLIGAIALLFTGGLDFLSLLGTSQVPSNAASYGWALFFILQGQITAIRFAHAFVTVEEMTLQLQQEVDRKLREVQAILLSIKQGIVMLVDGQGTLGAQYSADAKVILGASDIFGSSIKDLILDVSPMDAEQKSMILSALEASIGEEPLGFELNAACLPREIQWRDRILELDWTPIGDKHQRVEKIMLCFRDVTHLRQLQREAEQHQEDLRIFQEIVEIPEERFQRFVSKAHEYLRDNRALVEHSSDKQKKSEILRELFINMHTLKGAARSFLLKSISAASHEVEQYYASLQANTENWDAGRLLNDINRMANLVKSYEQIGRNKLGWNTSERLMRVQRSVLVTQLRELQRVGPQLQSPAARDLADQLKRQLQTHSYDRLTDVLEESTRGFESIARNLKKALPHFAISPSPLYLQEEGTDLIASIMTHLLRNSLDHGLETPEQRAAAGKAPEGRVELTIEERAGSLLLHVADDGRGLDLQRIRSKAEEQGLLAPHAALSREAVAALIFHPGLSTKDVVTEISGRGVGLDAVKTYLEQAGGSIRVVLKEAAPGSEAVPFAFEIALPPSLWVA